MAYLHHPTARPGASVAPLNSVVGQKRPPSRPRANGWQEMQWRSLFRGKPALVVISNVLGLYLRLSSDSLGSAVNSDLVAWLAGGIGLCLVGCGSAVLIGFVGASLTRWTKARSDARAVLDGSIDEQIGAALTVYRRWQHLKYANALDEFEEKTDSLRGYLLSVGVPHVPDPIEDADVRQSDEWFRFLRELAIVRQANRRIEPIGPVESVFLEAKRAWDSRRAKKR